MSEKFSANERRTLLKVPYVGPTVISRLEEVGYGSFDLLKTIDQDSLLQLLSEYLQSTCYHNSPQARKSISGAIECAKHNIDL